MLSVGRDFLAAFRPMVITKAGRDASARFGLPPFIDGSIRREPDLESPYPSISALCRGALFAPRLRPGDRVAFITVKGAYPPLREEHRGSWRCCG
jgi:hypothetical protein